MSWDSPSRLIKLQNAHMAVILYDITHRSDSMWGTDYIANPFFFLLRVSRTTIKNPRWQLGGEITFGKFVTLLVKQLKKKCVHKNCATGYWLPLSLFNFLLNILDQRCHIFSIFSTFSIFSSHYLSNFSTEFSSQIFDCCHRNFLFQE